MVFTVIASCTWLTFGGQHWFQLLYCNTLMPAVLNQQQCDDATSSRPQDPLPAASATAIAEAREVVSPLAAALAMAWAAADVSPLASAWAIAVAAELLLVGAAGGGLEAVRPRLCLPAVSDTIACGWGHSLTTHAGPKPA